MLRLASLAAALLLSTAPAADAQSRNLDRDFGQTSDEWCREGDWDFSRRSRFCEVREETLSGNVVDLDTGGNGGIRVRGSNRSDVRLRARVVTSGRSDSDARALARDVDLQIRDGRVRVNGPERTGRDEWWTVSFELEVPRNVELILATRNGGIAIHDYSGRADVRTVNGGLALGSVAGDIRGETVNGGIAVQLDGRRWDGTGLDLTTRNGGVVMDIPGSYSAELEVGTTNGGIDIDFPITVQGRLTRLNRRISTTLGSGGPPVRVMTTNGGVRIRRR
jgi:hypothetical protein